MNKLSLAILIALGSTNAAAFDVAPMIGGKDVTKVPASEYEDQLVRISTPSGGCGAGVIAGKFLITAGHCAEVEGTVTIYQSHDTSYTGGAIGHVTEYKLHTTQRPKELVERLEYLQEMYQHFPEYTNSGHLIYMSQLDMISDTYIDQVRQYPADVPVGQELRGERDHNGDHVFRFLDLAILELAEPIKQTSSFSIGFIRDEQFQDTIMRGERFTFKGWGQTDDGYTYDMMQGDFYYDYSKLHPYGFDYHCGESDSTWCSVDMEPMIVLRYENDFEQNVLPGDSGTPLIKDGIAYGVASNVRKGNTEKGSRSESSFYEFAPHKSFLVETINQVTTPNLPTIDLPVSGKGASLTYAIQNFTKDTAIIDIPESGSIIADGYAIATHDCGTELETLESCQMTIDVFSAEDGLYSHEGVQEFDVVSINGEEKTIKIDVPTSINEDVIPDQKNYVQNLIFTPSYNGDVQMAKNDEELTFTFALPSDVNVEGGFSLVDSEYTHVTLGQCNQDTRNNTVTCIVPVTDLIKQIPNFQSRELTVVLYQGANDTETTVDLLLELPETIDAGSNAGGSGGSSGGSLGLFGLIALSFVNYSRRKFIR